jgi:hypothetical protein
MRRTEWKYSGAIHVLLVCIRRTCHMLLASVGTKSTKAGGGKIA